MDFRIADTFIDEELASVRPVMVAEPAVRPWGVGAPKALLSAGLGADALVGCGVPTEWLLLFPLWSRLLRSGGAAPQSR